MLERLIWSLVVVISMQLAGKTKDGYNLTLGTNYLGHYYLVKVGGLDWQEDRVRSLGEILI